MARRLNSKTLVHISLATFTGQVASPRQFTEGDRVLDRETIANLRRENAYLRQLAHAGVVLAEACRGSAKPSIVGAVARFNAARRDFDR